MPTTPKPQPHPVPRAGGSYDPERLSGAVLALPVVNPPALGAMTRATPSDSDPPDVNRIFPGKGTWTAELITKAVVREILPHTSALIDNHPGIWASSFGYVVHGTDFPDDDVDGVMHAMRALGMLEGAPKQAERYLVFETKDRVNPSFGGFFEPTNVDEHFGREVTKGDLLGRVISPYTFDVLEELRAPFDGYVAYFARWYPVRPGDWAYGIVPKDHPGTRWIDANA